MARGAGDEGRAEHPRQAAPGSLVEPDVAVRLQPDRQFGTVEQRRDRRQALAVEVGIDAAERRQHQVAAEVGARDRRRIARSEEHTSELQSLMRISYSVFRLKKKKKNNKTTKRT